MKMQINYNKLLKLIKFNLYVKKYALLNYSWFKIKYLLIIINENIVNLKKLVWVGVKYK